MPSDINSMTDAEYKVYENRVRRMADRQSLQVVKSRRRDERASDYGRYMLVDPFTNAVVHGGNWELALDDVEDLLLKLDPAERALAVPDCPECGEPTQSLSGQVKGATMMDRYCGECGHSFRVAASWRQG